jgi:hypothetical protein
LAGHVLCVWSQTIGAGESAHRQRVLPDGCADIVWIGEAPAVVAGPATGPVVVPLAPGTTVVGVRLRPGAAPGVFGTPASELSNRDTPLADVWGAGADALSARIIEQPSIAARLAAADAALAERLAEAGYADQAHMSRELRTLTGCSRGALLHDAASALELSDLFKTEAAPRA